MLKTTNSAFIGFYKCEGTTLKDAEDRVLSTVVEAQWKYNNTHGLDFCGAWLVFYSINIPNELLVLILILKI